MPQPNRVDPGLEGVSVSRPKGEGPWTFWQTVLLVAIVWGLILIPYYLFQWLFG